MNIIATFLVLVAVYALIVAAGVVIHAVMTLVGV